MKGQYIKGSPYHVDIFHPPIMTIKGVKEPRRIAVNKAGEIIVSESYRHSVSVFDPSGKRLQSFGEHGIDLRQFRYPSGVALDSKGNFFVTDMWNDRIQKFTREGKFLAAVGNEDKGPLMFDHPYGITFNAWNGRVYVSEWDSQIWVLNSDLSYYGKFDGRTNLADLACDSSGNVYCNYDIFTAEGKFVKSFKRKDGGELPQPSGIAIDSNDRLYVGFLYENFQLNVSVFTLDGEFVKSFGTCISRLKKIDTLYGKLAVDSSGAVYVTMCNQIQKFVP